MDRVLSGPGALCICVDRVEQDHVIGKLFHRSVNHPVEFDNLLQMVVKAEKIFDCSGVPQAFLNERSFKRMHKCINNRRKFKVSNINPIPDYMGEKATFVVNVQYRQHASWQGKVTWVESGESCSFRSALELIKLMDSTIQNSNFKMEEPEEEKSGYDR